MGTPGLIWHHPAALRNRLILKQLLETVDWTDVKIDLSSAQPTPTAQGVGAVAVVGLVGADPGRGLRQWQRQQSGGGQFLAAGLAGVIPLAGCHVLGQKPQPGQLLCWIGDQAGRPKIMALR